MILKEKFTVLGLFTIGLLISQIPCGIYLYRWPKQEIVCQPETLRKDIKKRYTGTAPTFPPFFSNPLIMDLVEEENTLEVNP